jgi:transposase
VTPLRESCRWTSAQSGAARFPHPHPPGFQTPARAKPRIDLYLDRIAEFLEENKAPGLPKKQHHTARRVYDRLRAEGYEGGYTQVKEAVRALKGASGEKSMPLVQRAGEAQMDFGEAVVKMDGKLRKAHFFAMALPRSGAMYLRSYPRE